MRIILLVILITGVLACQKDDTPSTVATLPNTLHYDGRNQSAPVFSQGISYAAARFSAAEIRRLGHTGKTMIAIEYYIDEVPDAITILVLADDPTRRSLPGDEIYKYQVDLQNVAEDDWNEHVFNASVDIPDEGVWLVLELDSGNRNLAIVGCDPGPRHPDGDIYGIFGDDNPGWTSFYDFSNRAVNINWNIRGKLQ